MSTVKTAYKNILEASTVSLTAGSEDPDFPLSRIRDRNISRPFKAASASTLEVRVDQGGTAPFLSVDTLFIPAGHNLDNMTLDIMHSDDDASYTPAVSQWTQSGSALIVKSWAAVSARYWKFIVTTPASAPEFAEVFLTTSGSWIKNPSRPAGRLDRIFNVSNLSTTSGADRFLVHGPSRRRRSYTLPSISEAQKNALLELNDTWAGAKPFWLFDHEGSWMYGRLDSPLEIVEEGHKLYSARFDFMEVVN